MSKTKTCAFCIAENSDSLIGMPNREKVCAVYLLLLRIAEEDVLPEVQVLSTLEEEGEVGLVVGRGREEVEMGGGQQKAL